MGKLTVQSKSAVDGAYIWAKAYVDGRPFGQTPIIGKPLPVGVHHVVLRREGYLTTSQRVVVQPGVVVVVSLDLLAVPKRGQ